MAVDGVVVTVLARAGSLLATVGSAGAAYALIDCVQSQEQSAGPERAAGSVGWGVQVTNAGQLLGDGPEPRGELIVVGGRGEGRAQRVGCGA